MAWDKARAQKDRLARNAANQKAQDEHVGDKDPEAKKEAPVRRTVGAKRKKAGPPDGERE